MKTQTTKQPKCSKEPQKPTEKSATSTQTFKKIFFKILKKILIKIFLRRETWVWLAVYVPKAIEWGDSLIKHAVSFLMSFFD